MLDHSAAEVTFPQAAENRTLVVGVIGMGYVGVPLAMRLDEAGFGVIGFDIDPERVALLNAGCSGIQHLADSRIADMRSRGFQATADMARVADADALLICVPTPLDAYHQPDLTYVIKTVEAIAPYLRSGQLVSLESTTWPGTTEEVVRPLIEDQGLVIGEDIYLVYSPEREDPGNQNFTTRTIPKVVGGATPACLECGMALYGAIVDRPVQVSSTQAAELTKLLENIHRAINIGLVNELKTVAHAMEIDIFEVIDAAATKPFGFTPYYPGPGLGGHCIPIDPFYLTWKAREFGLHTRFIELAGEINASMPDYVVGRLVRALSDHGVAMKGARILVLGIAYKPNVDDCRESPSIEVMAQLRDWGVDLAYSDPHVPVFPKMRKHRFDLASTQLSADNLEHFDAIILLTHHSAFDYELIYQNAKLIIDTRGVYRDRTGRDDTVVIVA